MSDSGRPPRRSPLHEEHLALGARMVPFAGWEMPVQYSSLLSEHAAVRSAAGLFDISHMGQFIVSGTAAESFLNHALTNDLSRLAPGQGQYTLLLNDQGGVIDDLIAYRTSQKEFFLVVNAARTPEDWTQLSSLAAAWRKDDSTADLQLVDLSDACAGMAIQGPHSRRVFATVFGPKAAYPERNTIFVAATEHGFMWLCGTGYTGESGFEFFPPALAANEWWTQLLAAVKNVGGLPCGLGARDTLRLEMGYPLNGSDLSPEHTPLQAGLGTFVALEKASFVGLSALRAEKATGVRHRLTALRMTSPSPPPRPHYPVKRNDETLGELTSGTLSPSLGCGIALAYLPIEFSSPGTQLSIEIRSRHFPAEVVKKPFYNP